MEMPSTLPRASPGVSPPDSGGNNAPPLEHDAPSPGKMGRRVQVGNYLATIRFDGPLQGTSGTWYGVEWDDPSRGKHDGNYNGVSYFTCGRLRSGSFIRPGPTVHFGRDFISAVLEKYVVDTGAGNSCARSATADSETLFMSGKRGANGVIEVQTVGWDKIRKKQRATQQLTVVGLAEMRVEGAGDGDAIEELTSNIMDADLSRNLLPDWDSVAKICRRLRKLEVLRLNSNRFAPTTVPLTSPSFNGAFDSLRYLSLNSTHMKWWEFESLSKFFPVLEEVHLGFNAITRLSIPPSEANVSERPSHPLMGLERLRLVNLEGNNIRRWDELERLSSLPSLETLLVNNNAIEHIKAPPSDADGRFTGFARLRSLNLAGNLVSSWTDIDNLNQYPSLRELRLKLNPVMTGDQASIADVVVISRVKKLMAYNGAPVTPRDRVNAELYYLNFFVKEKKKDSEENFHKVHPRWEELCVLHGSPDFDDDFEKGRSAVLKDRLMEITIIRRAPGSSEPQRTVKKKLLGNMTVRTLKSLVQRILDVPVAKQKLLLEAADEQGVRFEVPLTDELRELNYYEVVPGAEIVCYSC